MPAETGQSAGAGHWLLPNSAVTTNFSQGDMRATNGLTDVAIKGPGFFEIQLPGGGLAYTRDGEFKQDAQGRLTTKAGNLVMGEAGPITLDRSGDQTLSISADGEVRQGAQSRGKIKVAEFTDPKKLTPTGGGLFLASGFEARAKPATVSTVHQGYLETANTNTVRDMTDLIAVMRSSEANQKIIQTQDERMGKVISELAG